MQSSSYELFFDGKNLRSIALVDKVVKMRRIVEGPRSVALIDYISKTGRLFNQAAMEILGQGNSEEALQMLLATQAILSQADPQNSKICSLLALSLKNLSLVYKRMGEISEAQECIQKILRDMHEEKDDKTGYVSCESPSQAKLVTENPALLHLNLCAHFAQQASHEKAKTHASLAVQELKQAISRLKSKISCDSSELVSEGVKIKMIKKVCLLAVAYFNLGCEFEHLGELEASLDAYKRAKGLNVGRQGQQQLESQLRQAIRQIKQQLKEENGGVSTKQRQSQFKRNKQQMRSQARKALQLQQPPQTTLSQQDNHDVILWRASESGTSGNESAALHLTKKQSSMERPVSDQQQKFQKLIQEKDNSHTRHRQTSALKSAPYLAEKHITPVKDKMCRTANSFITKEKEKRANVEESEQRGILTSSWSQSKRPASAQDIQKNLFGTQLPRHIESAGAAAPVRMNNKATKCLKHANWTQNWLNRAFISVENSIQFEKTLRSTNEQNLKAQQTISITEDSELENEEGSSLSNMNQVKVSNAIHAYDHQYQPSISINIRPVATQSTHQTQSQHGGNSLQSKRQQRRPASQPEIHQFPPEVAMISQPSLVKIETPVFSGGSSKNLHFEAELQDFMRRYVYPDGPAIAYLSSGYQAKDQQNSPNTKRLHIKHRKQSPQNYGSASLNALPSLSTNYRQEIATRTGSHEKRYDSASSRTKDGIFVNGKLSMFSSATKPGGVQKTPAALSAKKQQSLPQKKVFPRNLTQSGLISMLDARKKETATTNTNSVKQLQMTHQNLLNFKLCDHNDLSNLTQTFTASPKNITSQAQRRYGNSGNSRRKERSQAKMLKRMSNKPPAIGAPRQQSESRMRQPNQRMAMSHSVSHVQAAERYTQGPILQLIRPIDEERSMLVTQTVNSKSKKREILVQYLIDNKSRSRVHNSQTPDMKQVKKPPLFIAQPVIPQQNVDPDIFSKSMYQHQQRQKRQESESAFTKALRQRVIRQTQDVFDKVAENDVQKIAMTDEDTPEEIAVFDSLQKGNTEKSSDEAEDFTRVDYDKAATVIQSLLRGKQARMALLNMQKLDAKKVIDTRGNFLEKIELDYDEYKDDSFHSAQGKSEEVDRSLERSLNETFENGARCEKGIEIIISESITIEQSPGEAAVNNAGITPDESIVDELACSVKPAELVEPEAPQQANDSSIGANLVEAQSDESGALVTLLAVPIISSVLVDGTTQTSGRNKTNDSVVEAQLTQEVVKEDEVRDVAQEQPSETTQIAAEIDIVLAIQQVKTQPIEPFVKFLQIDAEEVELVRKQVGKNVQLQAVLLPFAGDRGVKIGFKGVQLESPTFQNELIHIELSVSRQELLEDKSRIDHLLSKIQIEPATGNLTLPLDGNQEVALFTMLVVKEQNEGGEVEVIVVFEYDGVDLSSGNVTVQTVRNPLNKVSIPLKKQASDAKLADIKLNLLKHLPRVICVNEQNHVYLRQAGRQERIGRALPMAGADTVSSNNTSRLYQAVGETFISQIDKELHKNEVIATARRSVHTQQVVREKEGFIGLYEDTRSAQSLAALESCSLKNLSQSAQSESVKTVNGQLLQHERIAVMGLKETRAEDRLLEQHLANCADSQEQRATLEDKYENPLPADETRLASAHNIALTLDMNDMSSLKWKSEACDTPSSYAKAPIDNRGSVVILWPVDAMTQKYSKNGSRVIIEAEMSDYNIQQLSFVTPTQQIAQLGFVDMNTIDQESEIVVPVLQTPAAQQQSMSEEPNNIGVVQPGVIALSSMDSEALLSSHRTHEFAERMDETIEVRRAEMLMKLPTTTMFSQIGPELTAVRPCALDSPRCTIQSDILDLNLQQSRKAASKKSEHQLGESAEEIRADSDHHESVQQPSSQRTQEHQIGDDETLEVHQTQYLREIGIQPTR